MSFVLLLQPKNKLHYMAKYYFALDKGFVDRFKIIMQFYF